MTTDPRTDPATTSTTETSTVRAAPPRPAPGSPAPGGGKVGETLSRTAGLIAYGRLAERRDILAHIAWIRQETEAAAPAWLGTDREVTAEEAETERNRQAVVVALEAIEEQVRGAGHVPEAERVVVPQKDGPAIVRLTPAERSLAG